MILKTMKSRRSTRKGMMRGGDLNTVQIVIAGGVVLLVVLIFSVYFMMQSPLD